MPVKRGHPGPCTTVPAIIADKKRAIQEATTSKQVLFALDDIYKLAISTENEWVKLAAWNAWLDRVIGKPKAELQIDKNETSVNVEVAALSMDQLLAIESIMRGKQPIRIEATIEEDIETASSDTV